MRSYGAAPFSSSGAGAFSAIIFCIHLNLPPVSFRFLQLNLTKSARVFAQLHFCGAARYFFVYAAGISCEMRSLHPCMLRFFTASDSLLLLSTSCPLPASTRTPAEICRFVRLNMVKTWLNSVFLRRNNIRTAILICINGSNRL